MRPHPRHRASAKPLLLTTLAVASTGTLLFFLLKHPSPPPLASTLPTTKPATRLATATKPAPPYTPKSLYDILKHDNPTVATTQPFEIPLDLRDAAHYTLPGPLYFDRNRLDLWITRPDAPPTPTSLRTANDEQTHVLRDHVLYVHWQPDDSANWFPHLIVSTPTGPELIYPSGHHLPLPKHDYDFSHPLSFNDQLALPTPTGVVVLRIENNKLTEYNHTLPGLPNQQPPSSAPGTEPSGSAAGLSSPSPNPQSAIRNPQSNVQLLLDYRGLLAFLPSTDKTQGSRGVSRFVDGKWTDLTPDNGFPEKILHIVPLLDGSAIAIVPTTPGHVDLQLLTLDAAPTVDTAAVTKLVESLSDDKEQTRQAAFDQLTRYGPSIFPTLQKLMDDQPPEAKIRLQQLLRSKLKPTLGPLTLINNELQLISRAPDGSALFYSSAGVSLPTPTDTPETLTPAWLSLRPGQPVRLLPDSLTHDLTPQSAKLVPFQNEWLLLDDAKGPCRFFGNDLVPLLPPNERHFSQFLGIDRRGRWLFSDPSPVGSASADHSSPTTQHSAPSTQHSPPEFLLLDPTLPDPTPRLPSWTLEVKDATVGWDQNNYPALKSGSAYALTDSDWKPLNDKTDTFSNDPTSPQKPTAPAVGPSSTTPSSLPTTQSSTLLSDLPLLTTPDGTRYYDARTQLISITKSHHRTDWPLPPEHIATMDPTLIYTDNHLFLFNQPGKCVRLTPTPNSPDPFQVDATFTKNIPNTDHPLRIWLDPANRICFAPDPTHLILFFPTGRIPPEIAQKMPADQLDTQHE